MESDRKPEIKIVINEMPTYEVLQRFLEDMVNGGPVRTYFDYQEGRFITYDEVRPVDTDTSPQ